jgi:hypothetical protein
MADEYNSMQANMGLVGSGGSFNPVGIPTPMPQAPYVRHPGEVSQQVTQQAQAAAYATQTIASPGGPMNGFARQYQANIAQIQGQQFNPFVAQYMANGMGMPGFMPGSLPSPAMMTPPSMGIFRNFAQQPIPMIPPTPTMPLMSTPFTPSMATPQFASPFEYSAAHGLHRGLQFNAAFQSAPGIAARAGTDFGFGMAGAGLGAHFGARFGARGAAIGGAIGMGLGVLGSEGLGFGGTAQAIADQMNPFRPMALRGAQMRAMSQDFVVGGGALDFAGRGLSTGASMNLGRRIEDLSYDSGFKRETGGRFSTQDLSRMTQMAGQSGMLDMAQTPEQIASEVKKVAKAVHAFSRIAGDPDVANAIRSLSQMRSLGMTYGESLQSLQSAKMFARMGGTSMQGIMEQGHAGAMTFQQMGMSGALGFNVGMGSYGMAGQAVAGGTFTPSQLAMLGGKSGIAQRDMESSAAMLRMPMMAAALGNYGPGGTFGLNAGNTASLAGGKINIGQMASMGADNLLAAVQKGGVGALGMFMAQQGELQDDAGRAMGPGGLQAAKMRMVQSTMKMMGLSGPQGFVTAAQSMGMDGQTALQLMRTANSPEYFRNVQRQFNVQRQDLRSQADAERAAGSPGFFGGLAQRSSVVRAIGDFGDQLHDFDRNATEMVNGYMTSIGETGEAIRTGRKLVRNPASLRASSSTEARLIAGLSKGDVDAFRSTVAGSNDDALFRVGGRGYGRGVLGGLRNSLGGDPEALSELLRAEGGFGGVLGRSQTGTALAGIFGGTSGTDVLNRGSSIGAASKMLLKAKGSSVDEQTGALNRLGGKVGIDKANALVSTFSSKLASKAKGKDSIFGGGALNREDLKAAYLEAAKEHGVDPASLDLQDILTAEGGQAELTSGAAGRDAFKMPSMDIGQNILGARSKDDLLSAQEKVATSVFGENGLLETDEDRAGALSQLFGQNADPRVSVVASLLQAAQDGQKGAEDRLNRFLSGLGSDRNKVLNAAKGIVEKADKKQKRYLRRAGVTAMGTAGNKDLLSNFKRAQNQTLAVKAIAKEKGFDTESQQIGGNLGGAAEAALDKQSDNFKQLSGEMAANFPASVQTFDRAATTLLDAAIKLGNRVATDHDAAVNHES